MFQPEKGATRLCQLFITRIHIEKCKNMNTSASMTRTINTAGLEQVRDRAKQRRFSRAWMTAIMIGADLIGLIVAGSLAVLLRLAIGRGFVNPDFYYRLLPVLGFFILVYIALQLYPGIGLNPVQELRRLSLATSTAILLLVAATFWTQTSITFSRLIFAFLWGFALVCVPLSRWLVRFAALTLETLGRAGGFDRIWRPGAQDHAVFTEQPAVWL